MYDEVWSNLDFDKMDWDGLDRNRTPFFTAPQTPVPVGVHLELEVDLRPHTDKVLSLNCDNGPSTVVGQVRSKFMQDAPRGVERLITPGTELLCGLHAARLSMKHQPSFRGVRVPTMKELLGIWEEFQKIAPKGNENKDLFEVSQLARITQTYLGRQGVASRLGVVSPSMGQEMFPVIYSDMAKYEDAERVLWVFNDEEGLH